MTTPQWALNKIQYVKDYELTSLDISGFQERDKLKEFPMEILELTQLTELDISSNQFAYLPDAIADLQNLIVLNLAVNQLTSLPKSIVKLQKLTDLNLGGNRIANLPEAITELQDLRSLYLRANQLDNLPDSIIDLQHLTELNLMENKFVSFPEPITRLYNLTVLDLSYNQLANLPETIDNLQKLVILDLESNHLVNLPDSLIELHNLTELNLNKNKLDSLPETIGNLKKLISLNLNKNQLVNLPRSITKLGSLKTLGLRDNQLSTPPQEVAIKGLTSIREYFRQLDEQGQDLLYEAKLLILGEGGAGKTTLSKKIENSNYELQEEEKSTEGVDVTHWSFWTDDQKLFRVNIWDFGGQEIYHATHQFFLTRRSLYILVADTRKEDTDFYYWLNIVDLLSDNSPLIIVKNEKQDRHREINERQLRGQFGDLKEVLATNFANNRGLDTVKEHIKHYMKNLPHIGVPLPKTWVSVRERLEKDTRNYISRDEYLDICKENGFVQANDSLQLSKYLHDIGVFLHFQDNSLLQNTIILKPKWGTDAVYKVLDNKEVIKNLGRFDAEDLAVIWSAPEYEFMHAALLQLMMKFKLCYEIPGKDVVYIAPQLLTENQPEYDWGDEENLLLRYTYEFMPKGLLLQFIVVMSDYIWRQRVWKSGVVLEKDKTRAEVIEFYSKRQIYVRVTGLHKKELMTIIIYELDRIHSSYKRLKYDKLIPCNCDECRINSEPHFYKYEQLQNFIEKRLDEIQCGATGDMVNVRRLIDDVVGLKSEKEVEEIMGRQRRSVLSGINVGDNFSGTIITGTVKNSFNKIESANISDELKESLKQLVQAVEIMNRSLPERQATESMEDLEKLVDEATKPTPRQKWYSISIGGLTKAAENLGKVGEPVIKLSAKVLALLA